MLFENLSAKYILMQCLSKLTQLNNFLVKVDNPFHIDFVQYLWVCDLWYQRIDEILYESFLLVLPKYNNNVILVFDTWLTCGICYYLLCWCLWTK